jgi:RimJ/RimL family protein N-acetyltransferase
MTPLPRLTTDRLVLRAFVADDAPTVERLAGDWEVANTTLNMPHPYPAGGGAFWIGTHLAAWEQRTDLTLAVCRLETPREIIGSVALSLQLDHARAELGYWIGAHTWGQGFATEAAYAIVSFGFAELDLNRVQARHFVRNQASGRVLQKVGMRLEGVHRQMYRRWDRFEDVAVYGVLAREWASRDNR